MPVYRFRVTLDVTAQDVLVVFAGDEEARTQATLVLNDLLGKCAATNAFLMQRIDVFCEDGNILLSMPSQH